MDETERRHSRGWVAFGAVLLGLLLLLCTCRDSRLIQEDLWGKGRTALESKSYDPTLLSFSGRDAFLRGEVASEEIKIGMEQAVRDIRGVRQAGLRNDLVVAAVTPDEPVASDPVANNQDPELNVAINAGQVTLSGLVPTQTKADIVAAAEQLYGSANIVDNLQTADDVANPSWMGSVLGLLPQIKNELPSGSLSARDGELTLSGTATTEQIKSGLGLAADSATDLSITNNIAVAAPALVPATLSLLLKDSKATLSGTVPEATIAPAVEAATQAVGPDNVVNNLQASDVEVPVWAPGLFGALPELSKQSADLGLNVADNTLTLTGKVDSPEKRESVAKVVQDAVGETVTVNNQLELTAAQVPSGVRVKIAQDAVQLSGTLPQITADRLLELSEGVSSTGSVVNQLSVDQNATAPEWLPKALELVPQYAKDVGEAELNIQDDTITLVGSVPTEDQKTALEATMREAVGTEPTIANQLRVVPILVEPTLSIKTQDNKVQLTGTVSQDIATKVSEVIPQSASVETTLEVAENIATPPYLPQVIDNIPAYLQEVKQAQIDLKDNKLTLLGVVPSQEKKTELGANFSQAAGSTVQVVNNLEVIPPVPAQLQVKVVDGVAQIEGNVPTDVAADIAKAVDSDPETTSVENQIASVLNVDVPTWLPAIVNVLPKVTADVKDADVNIVADTITLGGKVKSDAQKADIESQVSTAAGPEVKVVNNLVVEPPLPAELRVKVVDGKVEVEGNIPQDLVTSVIEDIEQLPAIEDEVASDNVNNNIASNPDVEVPAWLPKVVDVLPTVTAEVKNADVAILGNTVTLGGTVQSQEEKISAAAQVSEAAGPEVEVVNNLVVEAPVFETPKAVELRIQEVGDKVRVQGNAEDALAQAATTLDIPADQASSEVEVQATADITTPDWVTEVVNILPQVTAEIQDADVAIVDKTITLAGKVASQEKKTELASQVAQAAGAEVEVINNLQVEEPIVTEPAAEPLIEEPVVEETQPIEEPVVEEAVEEPVVEEEPVIEEVTPTGSAPTEPITAEPTVEEPVIEEPVEETQAVEEPLVEEAIITESITEESAQEPIIEEELVAEQEPVSEEPVQTDISPEEPVEAVTSEAVAPIETETIPETVVPNPVVRIDVAGTEVRLTGLVPTTTSADIADNGFTNKTVINALEPSNVLDAPWLGNFYSIAPKVASDLNRVSMVLEDKVLTLQGVTGSNEQRDTIGDYVTDAMQPDITVINRLTVETKIPFIEGEK